MSKYIIEIPDDVQYVLLNGKADNKYYTAVRPIAELEELNSDYINEHYGELQDEAYQAGLNDAWEAARKIALMDTETSENVTGYFGLFRIMENLTPMQAIAKLKAYEDKQKAEEQIKVGDEVEVLKTGSKYLIAWISGSTLCGFSYAGITCRLQPSDVRKTGKHYDIQSILEAMRK